MVLVLNYKFQFLIVVKNRTTSAAKSTAKDLENCCRRPTSTLNDVVLSIVSLLAKPERRPGKRFWCSGVGVALPPGLPSGYLSLCQKHLLPHPTSSYKNKNKHKP